MVKITVLIKEESVIYLEDDKNFIVNITSFKMDTYADSDRTPGRATIIPTAASQSIKSSKSAFSVIDDPALRLNDVIAAGNFSNAEAYFIPLSGYTLKIVRSSAIFENLNVERSASELYSSKIFVSAIFLQDKSVAMTNMNVDVPGIFFMTTDPLNGHFKNILFEGYRLMLGFLFETSCNYPEAASKAEIVFDELTVVTSKARLPLPSSGVVMYSGVANVTLMNSDLREFYFFLSSSSVTTAMYTSAKCIPDDGAVQIYNYKNVSLALEKSQTGEEKRSIITSIFISEKYRKSIAYASDCKITNFHDQDLLIFYFTATPVDECYFTGNLFSNITKGSWDNMVIIGSYNQVILSDNTFEDGLDLSGIVLRLAGFNFLQATNTVFRNYNLNEASGMNYFAIQTFPWSSIYFDTLTVEDCRTLHIPIIASSGGLDVVSITNGTFTNIVHDESTPLFSFSLLKSFQFVNHRFSGVSEVNGGIVEGVKIQLIDLSGGVNSTISQISFDNCHVEVVKIGAVFNYPTSMTQLTISNLNYTNSHFSVEGNLLEPGSIKYDGDLLITLDNLLFSNISFPIKGKILSVEYQLKTDITVSNSKFSDLKNAGIEIEFSNVQNPLLNTKVKLISNSFDSIISQHQSFISVNEGGRLEVDNCTFTNVSSFRSGAVVNAGFQKSETVIQNSIFQNNSAAEGGLFFIESESSIA